MSPKLCYLGLSFVQTNQSFCFWIQLRGSRFQLTYIWHKRSLILCPRSKMNGTYPTSWESVFSSGNIINSVLQHPNLYQHSGLWNSEQNGPLTLLTESLGISGPQLQTSVFPPIAYEPYSQVSQREDPPPFNANVLNSHFFCYWGP